jgi:hypothetical protein
MSLNKMPVSNAIAIDEYQIIPCRLANRLVQDLGLSKTVVLVPNMSNGKTVLETFRHLDDHVPRFPAAPVIGYENLIRKPALLRQTEKAQFQCLWSVVGWNDN